MNKRIYLSPPHLNGSELEYIKRAIEDNWIAPVGPDVDQLEKDLEELLKIEKCVALNSGTSAIHLALRVLDVKEGDVVFVQSHNHVGCVNPILYQKATPVFIDSEEDTWNLDPEVLEKAIKEILKNTSADKLKAVIAVHIYGMPAKLKEIKAVADKYNLHLIEDAAESLGSTYEGQYTGTFGKMGALSFNGNKIFTTSGGGALISSGNELIKKANYLAGQAKEDLPYFEHREMGYNYKLSNILAALGRSQLKLLPERIEQRRRNYQRYVSYFTEWNKNGFNIKFQEEPGNVHCNRWLTGVLMDPMENKGITREDLRLALEKENIESRPLWKPMHMQPLFEKPLYYGNGISEKLFEEGLCLPSGSNLGEDDFERIFGVLDKVFQNR